MRLPNTAHTSRPWRIHELTDDFRLEDVWALPGWSARTTSPGWCSSSSRSTRRTRPPAPSARSSRSGGSSASSSAGTLRTPASALGCQPSATGCRRICATPHPGRASDCSRSRSLYLIDDEWAAEIANRTMHGVVHIGRVRDEAGCYRAQLAVLVKPNGRLGTAYMAAIKPFRHLIVYPSLMRELGRT